MASLRSCEEVVASEASTPESILGPPLLTRSESADESQRLCIHENKRVTQSNREQRSQLIRVPPRLLPAHDNKRPKFEAVTDLASPWHSSPIS